MTLSKQSFENIVNNVFTIFFEIDNSIVSELIEVKSINSHTLAEGQAEPFSLVFQAIDDRVFEQNTFQVKHTELGELELFLVPIGADEKGVRYEAVFT
jgi:hypothetical protein